MCPDDTSLDRPRRFAPQESAARTFQVTARTIQNWLSQGYITGYRVPRQRQPWVDLDEIERAFRLYPRTKMRDGRKAYGSRSRIVSIPLIVVEPRDEP